MLQAIRRLLTRPEYFRLERELAGLDLHQGRQCALQGTPNNAAERAIRPLTLGRRNWTFLGSDTGGDRAAVFYTLIQTCKLNAINPEAYLADVIGRIADHPAKRIDELLPWNWRAPRAPADQAA